MRDCKTCQLLEQANVWTVRKLRLDCQKLELNCKKTPEDLKIKN